MLELWLGKKVYENFAGGDEVENVAKKITVAALVSGIVVVVMYVLFGTWAAMLSWKANTLAEWGTAPKVIFSLFAFFGGISYLFNYFVMKYDLVLTIEKLRSGLIRT